MSNLVLVDSDSIAHAVASRITSRNGLTACGHAGTVSIQAGEVTCPICLAALMPAQPAVPVPHFKAQSSLGWTAPKSVNHYLSTKERGLRLDYDYPTYARGGNSKPKRKAYRRMPRGNWKKGE